MRGTIESMNKSIELCHVNYKPNAREVLPPSYPIPPIKTRNQSPNFKFQFSLQVPNMDPNEALQKAIERDRINQEDARVSAEGREAATNGNGEAYWQSKLSKMYRALPPETKVSHGTKRRGVVSDPTSIQLKPQLAAAVAMTQGNSPLDPMNNEHVPNLVTEHKKLKRNLRHPAVRPVKKLTKSREKGGFIFTTLKNKLVYPNVQ